MSKIAILAFGSLVWSPRTLKFEGDWQYGGPELAVEFSRIARDGRLVLTYTPQAKPQPTFYVQSAFTDLDKAIANVAEREVCQIRHISAYQSEQPEFRDWLQEHGFDHALHCALPENFAQMRGEEISGFSAKRYLDTLNAPDFDRAWEYITKAPREIVTPVRSFLQDHYMV